MKKIMQLTLVFVMAAAMVLGVLWALWHLWCWVLPQVYASGPPALLKPSYWLFVACWMLFSWIGREIFGRPK